MVSIVVSQRQLVLPGELLAEGPKVRAGENTYRVGDKIYSSRIGLVSVVKNTVSVIALRGSYYLPNVGDTVIGIVIDVGLNGWLVDIKAPYNAFLPLSEVSDKPINPKRDALPKVLDVGDLVLAKVIAFDRTRSPLLTIKDKSLGKLQGGHLVEISPTKIPRLIGKKGSMISMIKRETGCRITVGQNGLILVSCKRRGLESLVEAAIKKIEEEAHTTGLTDRIMEFLRRNQRGSGGSEVVEPSRG